MTGAGALSFLSIIGADLSLTCPTFLSLAPPSMLLSSAPYTLSVVAVGTKDLPSVAYSASTLCLLLGR
jgi:hypothetical protein